MFLKVLSPIATCIKELLTFAQQVLQIVQPRAVWCSNTTIAFNQTHFSFVTLNMWQWYFEPT